MLALYLKQWVNKESRVVTTNPISRNALLKIVGSPKKSCLLPMLSNYLKPTTPTLTESHITKLPSIWITITVCSKCIRCIPFIRYTLASRIYTMLLWSAYPIGNPFESFPTGIVIAGSPRKFAGNMKRIILDVKHTFVSPGGFRAFLLILGAVIGVVGVTMKSISSKTRSKCRAILRRIFWQKSTY